MYFKRWETIIHCDGVPIEEYAFRIVDDYTVSCYIASEAGKSFSVHWKNHLSMIASADCYMDGHCMGCSRTPPEKKGSRWGIRTNTDVRQPFQFTPLTLTDNDEIASPDDPSIDNLGIIEVKVCRVRISRRPPKHHHRKHPVPAHTPIHERSKKAGTHCVSLGEAIRCAPHSSSAYPQYKYLDNPKHPYIRFIFHYRPRALLQAQGIIPRDLPILARQDVPRGYVDRVSVASAPHSRSRYAKAETELPAMLRAESTKRESSVGYAAMDVGPSPGHPVIDVDADVIDLTMDD
ncbi:uncharacterized protein FIBRA_00213 [Fibroporia radiculosa]|uniref:DUF7918 domain-containing protein n=1 Tax=Fibroporia radiculosa TaxID=599839 RepID=J7S5T9_9APHY|nr:uncharacterized protein FIBRA_00213 [Fibroporia radiculosa]CCL98219.1 predicted protein [Fibroporia radiculosa]